MNDAWVKKVLSGGELNRQEVREACHMLFDDNCDLVVKEKFLRELHRRKETPQEVALFAEALLEQSIDPIPPALRASVPLLDVCGTGGDRLGLFNISTAVMFTAAACGAFVVKVGNRSFTSRSGGADVLEALGVNLFMPPEKVPAALETAGCAFLFAPAYHPGFRSIAAVRRLLAEENSPTIFNFLGPLLNPARPSHQLVGVFQPLLLEGYARTLSLIGRQAAWVVCGEAYPSAGVMDEVSTLGNTTVCSLHQGNSKIFQIHPRDFRLSPGRLEDLLGGDASKNARILLDIFNGSDRGSRRDIVLANTAAALRVCEIADDLPHGVELASQALNSGEALRRLHTLARFSTS